MGRLFFKTCFIRDGGYALASWLMTSPTNRQTHQEPSFHQRHTHSKTKRTIVCLDTAGVRLLYKLEKVCIERTAEKLYFILAKKTIKVHKRHQQNSNFYFLFYQFRL